MKPSRAGLALFLFVMGIDLALASTLNVTARFRPDASNPSVNTFENTTPNTGYCASYPTVCTNGIFSLSMTNTTVYAPLAAQGVSTIRVPREWRELEVRDASGKTHTVKIRIVGFGSRVTVSPGASVINPGSNNASTLWTSSWGAAPANCTRVGAAINSNTTVAFFWLFNNSNPCEKVAQFNIPNVRYMLNMFMYELITPDPLDMSMGTHTGSLVYRLGPGQDFDFGPDQNLADPVLQLNFTLSVEHALKVQFPPGNQLELAPTGGWPQWLLNGRRAEAIAAQQNFQQWASEKFSVQLRCQYPVGNDCGIQNTSGHQVAVKTRLTLPNGLLDSSNAPVNQQALGNNAAVVFHPTRYVDNQRATVFFEVGKDSVEQMMKEVANHYRGDITLIWDGDI